MRWLAVEVFKLRRMRVTWVLLLIMVAFEALMIAAMAYWVETSPDARKIAAEEREQAVAATSFPGSIPSTLSFIASLGPLFAIILAARLAGDEYAWGTAKQLVSMGMGRQAYVASKLAGATAGCLFLLAGGLLGGAVVSLIVTAALGRAADLDALTLSFLAQVAQGAGIAWFVLVLYSALTVCVAGAARSSATATAICILVFLLEGSLVGSLATRFATVAKIAPYTIGYNVNRLAAVIERGGFSQAAEATQAQGQAAVTSAASAAGVAGAFVVLGVWLAVFVLCSFRIFSRQELGTD